MGTDNREKQTALPDRLRRGPYAKADVSAATGMKGRSTPSESEAHEFKMDAGGGIASALQGGGVRTRAPGLGVQGDGTVREKHGTF